MKYDMERGKVRIELKVAKCKSMLYKMKKIAQQKILCICKSKRRRITSQKHICEIRVCVYRLALISPHVVYVKWD